MGKIDYFIMIRNKTLLIIYSKYLGQLATFLYLEKQDNYYLYSPPLQHIVSYMTKVYKKNIYIARTM